MSMTYAKPLGHTARTAVARVRSKPNLKVNIQQAGI